MNLLFGANGTSGHVLEITTRSVEGESREVEERRGCLDCESVKSLCHFEFVSNASLEGFPSILRQSIGN